MPYATPTSPFPSPAKETPNRKGQVTPPTHIEDVESGPSNYATGPMPGIPRRSSSHHGATTPRRAMSPSISRQTSATHHSSPLSRPLEGLPRRTHSGQGVPRVSGLPVGGQTDDGDSLGLKLLPSPSKAPRMQRGLKDSMSSTSTIDSPAPSTPAEESPTPTPVNPPLDKTKTNDSVPFPDFEPPQFKSIPHHLPRLISPTRPTLNFQRLSSTDRVHHRGHIHGHSGSLQINLPTSASATSLAPPASYPTRPGVSMVRKKSGEVVKPSLKVRSMSTPDLTRKNGDSEPNSPDGEFDRPFSEERSKSVRFAGDNENDERGLENVVLFLREQKVTAVSKAADGGALTETETERDSEMDASDFVQFRTRRNAAARARDEEAGFELEGGSRVPRTRVDFAPDARGALRDEHVVLERVELVNTLGHLSLKGQAIVRNVSFRKWVAVRFTMDHWQTVSETSGLHMVHIPSSTTGDEGWDRFSFTIKLDDYKRKLEERQLILCIRFSVEGQDWWDSNNGMNYNFNFKKTAPKRVTRASGPAAFGGGFMRVNDGETTTLPGLKANRNGSTAAAEIHRAFGTSDKTTGPRSWVFPKASGDNGHPSGRDSPASSPAPAASFRAPAVPDPHAYLSLSTKYCAPSPPSSPPADLTIEVPILDAANVSSPEEIKKPEQTKMDVPGAMPVPAPKPGHERRSSFNGQASDAWDSFAQAMESVEATDHEAAPSSTDGETTPVAPGSRSPALKAESDSVGSSPEVQAKPLSLKRSASNLRELLADGAGLITPPSSNLSSPPSPAVNDLSESSPINTVGSDSASDLASWNMTIPTEEERGRSGRPFPQNDYKTLSNSYQEFLDRFCFFQSPRTTPMGLENHPYSRQSQGPGFMSGTASPTSFPFYASNSSDSPRGTPTPTRHYDSAQDAFNFYPAEPAGPPGSTTPRATPPVATPAWTSQLHGPTGTPPPIAETRAK
ncbi:putative phosphatase regulatory subunit-domain-containing protein [Naematelia encephala]|uniref:Putative phosphatase regulatory subunit-domain-containing protein n=1 Tax=Naematelia encephala TaxID=71784 RepID=A0A1Y2BJX2_9TREE|nr:putative phosphatase regulatory subunit-domain-containing protein [Naematelia encephala]